MRRDIFLHFLNRDSREIFGVYNFQSQDDHFRLLRRALNASVMMCEDKCTAPPGFIIEDEIAFGLAETQTEYLRRGLLEFPMRESGLTEYAEKKRVEYHPMRDRYSGLFSDTRLEFLGRHAAGIVRRKSVIGDKILSGWQEGIDKGSSLWLPVKKLVEVKDIEGLRAIPQQLSNDGTALTWAAIQPLITGTAIAAAPQLRNALQNIYFTQYCKEFRLIALSAIPYMHETFSLPVEPRVYNYVRFQRFLAEFGLVGLLLDGTADVVSKLKQSSAGIAFMDAYSEMARVSKTHTDLVFAAARAAAATKYGWSDLPKRFGFLSGMPTDLELLEIEHAMSAAADVLSDQNGLQRRSLSPSGATLIGQGRKLEGIPMTDVVLFVALQEELDELAKSLELTKNFAAPAAHGTIGSVPVSLLCPNEMGRVAAAVEVTTFLERRREKLPKLLLIVGLAGGFQEEGTQPGHIICVDKVIDLAIRKVTDEADKGFVTHFRRNDYSMNLGLRKVLHSDAFPKKNWIAVSEEVAEWPDDRRPSLHFGRLASVDEVVASDDWREKILKSTEKLLGVEMEAGGVCAAAHKYGVPVSMVRVVSDNADPAKADDNWRKIGMRTVAQLLMHLDLKQVIEAMKV